MKVQLFGRPTTYEELPQGSLFRYSRADGMHIGLKASDLSRQDAYVALDPIDSAATPRFFYGNVVAGRPVIQILDAELRPSSDPIDWILGRTEGRLGDLVLSGGKTLLLAVKQQDEVLIDVESGEETVPRSEIIGTIRRWTIVQMIDRAPETLFEHAPVV